MLPLCFGLMPFGGKVAAGGFMIDFDTKSLVPLLEESETIRMRGRP